MALEKHIQLEEAYLKIRDKEKRIYSDMEVKILPYGIPKSHVHFKEWKIRQLSLEKLISITQEKNYKRILDLGCGNGWMSHQLSKRNFEVVGLDINDFELEQARRVFKKDNLSFIYGDIFDDLQIGTFDLVVVSAAFQYFQDPQKLIKRLFKYLNPEGDVIVMDTFFYEPGEVAKAQERSIGYYTKMEVPQMSKYYFHHCKDVFKPFRSKLIYVPGPMQRTLGRLGRIYNPFPIHLIHK
ncbi:class I SAM-dependent methyltransferase [Ekhidna sp. To15]|uniref:class I SAM-dependent methyltransferase n=1 Tax=Ekhidna sp. To15 TaxID=3395267 RepID=UPI003F51E41E